MKILFISSDNNKTSGAFLCLVELNKYLMEYSDIKTLIILPKKGDGIELLDAYKIPYKLIPSYSWITYKGFGIKAIAKSIFKWLALLYNLYAISKIRSIIKKDKINIVHTNTIFSYVGAYAAYKENVPHLWHIREDINTDYKSKILHSNYGYYLIRKSSKIIAVSNIIKKAYEKDILPKEISIIYDGVTEELYKKRLILKNKIVTFTCIGAFVPHKNQSELIAACYKLKNAGIYNFSVKLVGRGPDEHALKKLVKRYSLEKEVEFCGIFDDITQVLGMTDILCITSQSEAFGRTTIEGMLHGCLIIGAKSKKSATKEIIEDGISGYLYEAGNPEDLAQLMLKCFNPDDVDKLRDVAREGQNKAKRKFVVRENAEKIIAVYKKML